VGKHFNDNIVKLIKLTIEYPDLRETFLSTDLLRFISSDLEKILRKMYDIQYFAGNKIDLHYIQESAKSLGIDSLYLSLLVDEVNTIEVNRNDFWVLADQIKTEYVKSRLIPVLLTEYESILKSGNEIDILRPINVIGETISMLLGKTQIQVKTEAEIKDIRARLKIYSGEVADDQKRFITGYKAFDNVLGGFSSSALAVIMGATGSGKTTLLLNLAYQLWITSKTNIMFFSLEMPTSQIFRRLDSRILNIDYEVLRKCGYSKPNDTMIKEIESSTTMFKVIDIPPRTAVTKIEEYILSSIVKPDVVIVDYIGLLGSHLKRNIDRWEVLDEVALALKYIAKRYQISVITASQITADAMKRKDTSIDGFNSYDVAGSKSISDHADLVLGLHYDVNLKLMNFNSVKSRDGAPFNFSLFITPERCHLYEIAK